MSDEPTWSTSPRPQPTNPDVDHKTVVEGLEVVIEERPSYSDRGFAAMVVQGYLADVRIYARDGEPLSAYGRSVERAKEVAVAAARRLHAAGVRGQIRYPVTCCDLLFTEKAAADAHQADHETEGLAAEARRREAAASEEGSA